MKAKKAQRPSTNAKHTAPVVDNPATATPAALGDVEERTVEQSAEALFVAAMHKRLEELRVRTQELEASVASLGKVTEDLKAALREAQLRRRRHVRQRVNSSELQISLKLFNDAQSATNTTPGAQVEPPVAVATTAAGRRA